MENLIENKSKKNSTDDEDGEEKKKRPVIKSATDLQRLKLEKLMKNPEKPIIIPEPPKEKDYMQTVPSFVRNVMGSSAGAGSGEFHVYRHLRRKEYARQKCIQAKSIREQLDDQYQAKLEQNRLESEAKTAKKRAKRLKKKQRAKKPKIKQNEEKEEEPQESDSNEEDENNTQKADTDVANKMDGDLAIEVDGREVKDDVATQNEVKVESNGSDDTPKTQEKIQKQDEGMERDALEEIATGSDAKAQSNSSRGTREVQETVQNQDKDEKKNAECRSVENEGHVKFEGDGSKDVDGEQETTQHRDENKDVVDTKGCDSEVNYNHEGVDQTSKINKEAKPDADTIEEGKSVTTSTSPEHSETQKLEDLPI